MKRGWGALLTAALLWAGAAAALAGTWIPAKAALAQHLLERAWSRAQHSGTAVSPWPWADTTPIARLRVPRMQVSTLVLGDASGASLAFGPGHLSGTPAPGAAGNSAIAGHRDTHFRFLADLAVGDRLELETADGQRHTYRVRTRRVVHERDLTVLANSHHREVTLLTCYPFDAVVPGGPLRYAVHAIAEPPGRRTPAVLDDAP